MSNYTQAISFGAKDVLTSTDPAKIILGANVDSELALIATAITSKLNTSDLAGNYTISGNITFTGTNVIPAAGLTGTVVDARLSANVPLLNAANVFTAVQRVSVADAVAGLKVIGATNGGMRLRTYVDATNGTMLEAVNPGESAYIKATIASDLLRLTTSSTGTNADITLNGVAASDFARLSQSNTFTGATQGIDNDIALLRFRTTAGTPRLRIGTAGGDPFITSDNSGAMLQLATTGGGAITLNGVAATDFARLSVKSIFTSAGASYAGWATEIQANVPATGMRETSAGADAKQWYQYVSAGVMHFGIANDAVGVLTDFATITRSVGAVTSVALAATAITLNGVAASDFARLSQSNTFASSNIRDSVSPSLFDRWRLSGVDKAYVGVGGGSAIAGLTSSDFGFTSIGGGSAYIGTNGNARLVLDNAGTLAGSTIIGVAFSDFARLSQAVAFAATVTAATGLTVSANGATITGNSTITGTLGGLTGLTVASGGVNITGTVTTPNTSANEVGYKGLPQNSQSVSYTTVLGDCNKNLHQTGATKTFTIDSNANVAAPIGTVLNFTCDNATGVSIAITTDTLRLAGTATTGTRTLAQYGVATAIKILATTWLISGAGLS